MTDILSGLDPTLKRIYSEEVSRRIQTDCGGSHPKVNLWSRSIPVQVEGYVVLWQTGPPPTRRTTLTVLGPDGFAAGKNSTFPSKREKGKKLRDKSWKQIYFVLGGIRFVASINFPKVGRRFFFGSFVLAGMLPRSTDGQKKSAALKRLFLESVATRCFPLFPPTFFARKTTAEKARLCHNHRQN